MRLEQRHRTILEMLGRRGYVSIEDLAAQFQVTPQTIRSDINALSRQKLLTRHHGGASLPPSSVVNTAYAIRHVENAAAKEAIAEAIARDLPDRASVFMTLGTTVAALAQALAVRTGMKIVTNSLEVARILTPRPDMEVVVAGGIVQKHNGGVVGNSAVEFVSRYKCDFLVTGIGAIDADGALLEFHEAEVAVAQAMLANARRVLVAADRSKFARTANYRLCRLKDVDALYTDAVPDRAAAARARAAGARIVVTAAGAPAG
jgi:DeoR family glycerol-3-phosphate regulon repressor